MAQRGGEQTRRRILKAATGLFAERGYERVTMKSIAAHCGVTESALYRHYSSKASLYSAVLSAAGTQVDVQGALAALDRTDDLGDILSGLAQLVITRFTRECQVTRLLLHSSLENHPRSWQAFREIRRPLVEFLARKLRTLQRRGDIQNIHAVITARCFVGMVMDCALCQDLWWKVQGRVYAPRRVIANNVQIYMRGLIRS
ncbi:MAG: helix-turn-helix domain-containing protein [Candidatus Zixiibacteriota bacterium]